MFILDITYVAPIEKVDALIDDHVAWLNRGREAGHLHAWGRKVPRNGGIVFATGTREEVELLANTDPFIANGVAKVTVTEFVPSFAGDGLEGLSR